MPDAQIPDGARERLTRMRSARGEAPSFFTSDLSVNEYYLPEQAGFEPLGFVMGSSFYHIGIQWTIMPFQNYELDVLTQGLYTAREQALERLQAEAERVEANGIVGVDVQQSNYGWGSHVIEFFALGTAVFREEHIPPHAGEPGLMLALDDAPRNARVLTRRSPTTGASPGGGDAGAAAG